VEDGSDIVDWVHFEKNRAELGPGFIRILSYFREDGAKSVYAIEQAMHEQNTVALVIPAHTLKGEARQFGAEPLAAIAEQIEQVARICIETHRFPDELVPDVVELRRLWSRTIDLFDKAVNPLLSRAPVAGGFGKKAANQGFGRI
jgi:HPt (histidine-containing phosphotransfer) domain-containing protein